jgi:hypothetical protein
MTRRSSLKHFTAWSAVAARHVNIETQYRRVRSA